MITTLVHMLVRLGAPMLGSILREEVGGTAGEASAQVIEALGRAFGVEPKADAIISAIETDPNAQSKVIAVENERSAEWIAYLTMATSQRNRLLEREEVALRLVSDQPVRA